MAKEILPHKLIISYNNDGKFRDGIIQYRIKEDGIISKEFKTISINNAGFSVPQFNSILHKVKEKAEKSEKIVKETINEKQS